MNNIIPFTDSNAIAQLYNFLAEEGGGEQVQFCKFSKGKFMYGAEDALVLEDEEFAVDMGSLSKGFICWVDGSPVEESMQLVSQGLISRDSLTDHGPYDQGDGWKEQISLNFTNLETGEVLKFSSSSNGGRKAITALASKFASRLKSGAADIVPVVNMVPSSYKHPKFGNVDIPKFEVVSWLTPAGLDEVMAGDETDDEGFVEAEIVEEVKAPAAAATKTTRRRAS
jgi:hypothetical protein